MKSGADRKPYGTRDVSSEGRGVDSEAGGFGVQRGSQ